jgi:hypothetical protein
LSAVAAIINDDPSKLQLVNIWSIVQNDCFACKGNESTSTISARFQETRSAIRIMNYEQRLRKGIPARKQRFPEHSQDLSARKFESDGKIFARARGKLPGLHYCA